MKYSYDPSHFQAHGPIHVREARTMSAGRGTISSVDSVDEVPAKRRPIFSQDPMAEPWGIQDREISALMSAIGLAILRSSP